MARDDTSESKEGAQAPRDASLRVDARTLSGDEQAFARLMGFGESAPAAAPDAGAGAAPRTARSETEPATTADAPPAPSSPAAAEPSPPSPSDVAPPPRDWEDIHPRAASLGRQAVLLEHADRVPAFVSEPTSPASTVPPRETLEAERDRLAAALDEARRQLAAAPAASAAAFPLDRAELEKTQEAVRLELEALQQERDRLVDALTTAEAARASATARAERLEAALRAARGPEGPVPVGEQALRAEVIGLRRRLEESGAAQRRLLEAHDALATDLAIARAHRDDRAQELDQQRSRIEQLEREHAQALERVDESLARQRELLSVVTRVQAENVELRSAQAALEETLEARDLELHAREEHLQVTRRGLAARDAQLRDAEQHRDQIHARCAGLEVELEQAGRAHADLLDRLARRDERIERLTHTLARVQEAIGRPGPIEAGNADPLPGSTGERPLRSAPDRATPSAATAGPSDTGPGSARPSTSCPPSPLQLRWRDARAQALSPDGPGSLVDALARRLVATLGPQTTSLRVTSLGGARLESEVELVRALEAQGTAGVDVRVLERSPSALAARRAVVAAAGLDQAIRLEAWDGEAPIAGEPAGVLLLADALWGSPAPDDLVARLADALGADGCVVFWDRLAGGPATCSAATSEKLAELWAVLPEAITDRPALATPPGAGDDGGAPSGPDPLPALERHFAPRWRLGLGHLADLFVGPARSAALAEAGEALALGLLASVDAIDESRAIVEALPARHGAALLLRRGAGDDVEPESVGLSWPTGDR